MKSGFIYIISAPNGYVKIGHCRLPYERFSSQQTDSPLVLTFEYVCECLNSAAVEKAVHERLRTYRRHREWFEIPVQDAVATIRSSLEGAVRATPHRKEHKVGRRAWIRPNIRETAMLEVPATPAPPDPE